jgi:hypothetical protein
MHGNPHLMVGARERFSKICNNIADIGQIVWIVADVLTRI